MYPFERASTTDDTLGRSETEKTLSRLDGVYGGSGLGASVLERPGST